MLRPGPIKCLGSLSIFINILLWDHYHRNLTKFDLFCSQRLGNRSGDCDDIKIVDVDNEYWMIEYSYSDMFGNTFHGAEGAASFLTCLGFKTVWFFSSAMLKPKGVVPQVFETGCKPVLLTLNNGSFDFKPGFK